MLGLLNEALLQADPEKTLAALLLLAPALPGLALPTAPRYHAVLARARRQKVQVGWGSWSTSMAAWYPPGCRAPRLACEVTPPPQQCSTCKAGGAQRGCPAR